MFTKGCVDSLDFDTAFKSLKNMDINNIHLSVHGDSYIAMIACKAYRINATFYRVLCYMKKGMSTEESIYQVSTELNIDYNVLFDRFSSFINKDQKDKYESYIRYKHPIIKERMVNKIACYLSFFYLRYVFVVLSFVCLITNIVYFYFNYKSLESASYHTLEMGVIFFIGYTLSLIIHEMGHAAATVSIGKRAKEIGFGFYLIFPVFYTDVTSVWNMGKKERILVSFGGVYFQLIVNVIIIGLIYLFPQNALIRTLNALVISNILVVLMSITPFFRNDGYWILSDYWEIPNLLKKSDNVLLNLCFRQRNDYTKKDIKLILFCLTNNMFRVYVFVRFAMNLYQTLIGLIVLNNQYIKLSVVNIFISIIGMYWILMNYYKMIRYGN